MKLRWYLALGIAAFVGGIVTLAPVATLRAWLKPKNAPATIDAYGLEGTIGEGHFTALTVGGRTVASDLHWKFRPLWLLLARAAFHIDGGGQAPLDGQLSFTPLGGVNVSDLRATMGARMLLTALGQPYLPIDGQTGLELQSLKLRGGQVRSAEGRVQARNLAWTLAKDPVALGDFEAVITTEKGDVLAKIQSLAGALEANGEARLGQDQSYEAHLQLRPKADAGPLLHNLISSIGQPDAQGWYHVRQQGKLQ